MIAQMSAGPAVKACATSAGVRKMRGAPSLEAVSAAAYCAGETVAQPRLTPGPRSITAMARPGQVAGLVAVLAKSGSLAVSRLPAMPTSAA